MGVDLEADVDLFTFGQGLHHATDGGGAEAISTDEQGDIGLAEHQLEAETLRPEFGHLELSLCGELDELDSDVLEEIPDLIGHQLHGVNDAPNRQESKGGWWPGRGDVL